MAFPTESTTIPNLPDPVNSIVGTDYIVCEQSDGTKKVLFGTVKSTNPIKSINAPVDGPLINFSPADIINHEILIVDSLDTATNNVDITIDNSGVPIGKKLTVFNKGYNANYYCSINFLSLNGIASNTYYFLFKDQKNEFMWDGSTWYLMNDIPRTATCGHTAFEDLTQYGYLDPKAYSGSSQLFINVQGDKSNLGNYAGRFLRDGALNTTQDDALQNITGKVNSSGTDIDGVYAGADGAFYLNNTNKRGTNHSGEIYPNVSSEFVFDASRVARTSNETRPKNIQGYYVIKGY